MDCKEFNHMVDKIIDNNINDKEEILYKEHIAECSQCRQDLEEILKVNEGLEGLSMQEPPINFTSQVVNRAKNEGLLSIKPKKITVLSKFAMAVASFLFLFLLLDYTILPYHTKQENLGREQDIGIQHYQEDMQLESKEMDINLSGMEIYSVEEQRSERGLRNIIVFVSAIVLASPFIIEVYKRKTTY